MLHFSPYDCITRPLIVRGGKDTPLNFNADIRIEEPFENNRVFIQLKQVLIQTKDDDTLKFPNKTGIDEFPIFVESGLGQKVYDTSSRPNYIGSAVINFGTISQNDVNPIIELNAIPRGNVNFRFTDADGLQLVENNANDSFVLSSTLVFQLYFVKSPQFKSMYMS